MSRLAIKHANDGLYKYDATFQQLWLIDKPLTSRFSGYKYQSPVMYSPLPFDFIPTKRTSILMVIVMNEAVEVRITLKI